MSTGLDTYSINLETITWTATKALLDLDDTFIGTPNYMGITYFWDYVCVKGKTTDVLKA